MCKFFIVFRPHVLSAQDEIICWRVLLFTVLASNRISLPISSHGIFQFNSEDALTHKWLSHWNTGPSFCWVGKPRFLGNRNRSFTSILFSRILNAITDRRRNPATCWKPEVRIVVLVSAPAGSNARWTRKLTKVAALGSQLMCWYLIPIRSKELWRFPGSQRFSRSWTSERLVFGVKCASDRRHKQTRLTAKTFLLLNGKSSFPWGLK